MLKNNRLVHVFADNKRPRANSQPENLCRNPFVLDCVNIRDGLPLGPARKHQAYSMPMLMLGREVCLPLDLVVGCPGDKRDSTADLHEYAQGLREKIENAHEFARCHLGKSQLHQKRHYTIDEHGGPAMNPDNLYGSILHPRRSAAHRSCSTGGRDFRSKPKVVHFDRLKRTSGSRE